MRSHPYHILRFFSGKKRKIPEISSGVFGMSESVQKCSKHVVASIIGAWSHSRFLADSAGRITEPELSQSSRFPVPESWIFIKKLLKNVIMVGTHTLKSQVSHPRAVRTVEQFWNGILMRHISGIDHLLPVLVCPRGFMWPLSWYDNVWTHSDPQ